MADADEKIARSWEDVRFEGGAAGTPFICVGAACCRLSPRGFLRATARNSKYTREELRNEWKTRARTKRGGKGSHMRGKMAFLVSSFVHDSFELDETAGPTSRCD